MRTIPIHSSLLRPQLLAGGERTLVMLNAMLGAILVFGMGGFVGVLTGVMLCTAVQVVLVLMAKKDDQSLAVYTRHIHLQKYYPAAAAPGAYYKPTH